MTSRAAGDRATMRCREPEVKGKLEGGGLTEQPVSSQPKSRPRVSAAPPASQAKPDFQTPGELLALGSLIP